MKAKGGLYSSGPDWGAYVVQDGLLITGQNPASLGPRGSPARGAARQGEELATLGIATQYGDWSPSP